MHGLIVNQLRSYVVSRFGRVGWKQVLEASKVPLPEGPAPMSRGYDDATVIGVVVAAAALGKTDIPELLGDFGFYLAGGLLRVYAPLIESQWRTIDVVEHVEKHIHTVVRLRDPNAGPPYLSAVRRSPTAVDVTYLSQRRLCSLAEGIIHGVAAHYDERVSVTQPECMLRGDERCLLVVELQSSDKAGKVAAAS